MTRWTLIPLDLNEGDWALVSPSSVQPFKTNGGLFLAMDIAAAVAQGLEDLTPARWTAQADGTYTLDV